MFQKMLLRNLFLTSYRMHPSFSYVIIQDFTLYELHLQHCVFRPYCLSRTRALTSDRRTGFCILRNFFRRKQLHRTRIVGHMKLTRAESRLAPLGETSKTEAEESFTHKRSHSYSGYIPYHLESLADSHSGYIPCDLTMSGEVLSNRGYGGRRRSSPNAAAASGSLGATCSSQLWPDTDSDYEEYVVFQRSRGRETAITLGKADYMRQTSAQCDIVMSHVSTLEPTPETLEATAKEGQKTRAHIGGWAREMKRPTHTAGASCTRRSRLACTSTSSLDNVESVVFRATDAEVEVQEGVWYDIATAQVDRERSCFVANDESGVIASAVLAEPPGKRQKLRLYTK